MYKYLTLLSLILLTINYGFSQNLVANGSFEQGNCPDTRNGSSYVCESWSTISSADYFTTCSKGEVKPLDNFMGQQVPYKGEAFAGMFTGHGTNTHISEILYTELLQPLEKGEKYRVEFYYSLADNAGLRSKSIGCALSKEFAFKKEVTPLGEGYSDVFKLKYTVVEQDSVKLSDTEKWMMFQQDYIAVGGEKYLYISGVPVKGNQCIKRQQVPSLRDYADYAYYYIDEVSIVKQDKNGSIFAPADE